MIRLLSFIFAIYQLCFLSFIYTLLDLVNASLHAPFDDLYMGELDLYN